jgi:hypothetical protein
VPVEQSEQDVAAAEREQWTRLVVAFGTAMRHTMLNHKEKSEKAWAEFADMAYDWARYGEV